MDNINLKGFTAIDNSILFDSNLSDNAFRFLMKIRHILTTKQESFNPCKAWVLKVCGISEKMYRKVLSMVLCTLILSFFIAIRYFKSFLTKVYTLF